MDIQGVLFCLASGLLVGIEKYVSAFYGTRRETNCNWSLDVTGKYMHCNAHLS
jgi:hypothetical protein